jgi:CubicO group peptidase (beta-lactamase class C family)
MLRVRKAAVVALIASVSIQAGASAQQTLAFTLFEQYVEPLRQQAGIPGISAAILQDGQVVWERGFGYRDVEAALPATADTPYLIADLTQTFTAVMTLMCIESGLLDLDEPIGKWAPQTQEAGATLRQLLAHATPGANPAFRYDPSRFAALAIPLEACGDGPYRKLIVDHVLDRLAMFDAVPGRDITTAPAEVRTLFPETTLERYASALRRLATPYRVDRRGRASRNELPPGGLDAAHGLVASVRDLARYDGGLEVLVSPSTLSASWTNGAASLPTGLGWFVQSYEGQRIVWHFGLATDAYSSLILKVPARRLTLILLANSDGLSSPFSLEKGDVTSSVFAKTFLRLFL